MCKNPASECQAVDHDVPAEEDPLIADESEPMSDDDSYMSDSAGSEDASDSDAESASANRVTPTMVIWHLMREKGLVSEEHYKQLQEMTVNVASLKSVAPTVRGAMDCSDMEDSCNDNSFSFGTDCDDDDDDEDDENDGTNDVGSNTVADDGKVEKDLKNNKNGSHIVGELHDDKDSKGTSIKNENELNSDKIVTKQNVETAANSSKHTEFTVTENNKETSGKIVLTRISETIKHAFMSESPVKFDEGLTNKEPNGDSLITQTEDAPEKTVDPKVNAGSDCEETMEHAKNKSDIAMAGVKEPNNMGNDKKIAEPESNKEITEEKTEINQSSDSNSDDDTSSAEINFENYDSESAKGKRTESIENILKELVTEKRITEESAMVLDTYANDLDDFYDCNRAVRKFCKRNETLRTFALFLNFYSPSAYKYIRETFNTPLPNHRILSKWYVNDDEMPGLTKKAFDILKRKASGKKVTCTLMSHAVFLTNFGLNYDQVDFGGGCNFEYTDKAVMSFLLMLVSLDEKWKIPIGYFFARSVPAETHASLIQVCLTQCHEAGVDVVAVTLDTPTPAEFLGCSFDDLKNLKTTFKHPECEREVAVWIDPCLALRSVHHTLKSKGVLYHDGDKKIRWNLIRKLRRLYSNDAIDYQKSLSPRYMELRNHIAKVGLTSSIFSGSLVPALSLCEELLPDMFNDSAHTQTFIESVNRLFDILNSSPTQESGLRRPLDVNCCQVFSKLGEIKAVIIDIFCNEKNNLSRLDKANLDEKLHIRSFVEGEPVSGFITFLICIESLKHLHGSLVGKQLARLATHKLCKDHIEDFVKNMRRSVDVDPDNFTGYDFSYYYQALLDELYEKPRLSDRTVRLDCQEMVNMQSPAADIKVTSGKRAFDEDYSYQYKPTKLPKTCHETRATKIVRAYSKALDTESDQAVRKNMVGYLAGWVAAKFARCLKCEVCVDALLSHKKLWFHKFITLKELKGVCLPSEELFRVCWECERALRSGVEHPQLMTLRSLVNQFPWSSLGGHHSTHHIHLVRAIVSRYIPLRVAVPLSNKETIRMTQMFSLIKCMHLSGMLEGGGLIG